MKKQIMKRAWEIYRTLTGDHIAKLSMALREAWAEARAPKTMREQMIARLETIAAASTTTDIYTLEVVAKDWEKYGKSRTYLSIVETCSVSKHYKVKDYGYVDNATGTYYPKKYGDARENYTFGGMSF